MNITVTDQPHCKKQVRIEIPGERVREETDRVATELARQVRVPGFRPGHVPKSVIKTRFRKELRDEVMSHLLPHSLSDAIKEKELRVIGEPEIDNLTHGEDESIDVTFTLEVAPEFELSNYRGLPLTKRVYKVTDEDVNKTIERLRETQAELVPIEDRGAASGDIVTVNITGNIGPATDQAATDESAATGDETDKATEPEEAAAEPEVAGQEAEAEQVAQPEEVKQQDLEI